MRRPVSRFLLVGAIVPLIALAGCGDDDTDTSTGETTATSDTAVGEPTDTTAAPEAVPTSDVAGAVEVGVGETEYGPVLTAPDGRTLYVFDDDVDGVSTCIDAECTEKWPPLLGDGAALSEEAAATDGIALGTVERSDGTTQITINGRPAYTMELDRPGEALCQGGDGTWWIIGTSGEPIRDDTA